MRLLNSKSLVTKSLVTKSLVRTGIIVASLALAGNAFAANDSHVAVNVLRTAHVTQTGGAAANYQPAAQQGVPIAQLGLFGLPIPVVAGAAHDTGDGSYDWSPSYDDSSPAIDDNSAAINAQEAADEENQEIQSMNDTNALNASMAAAEEENDAANAAALQTEINAGM
jgi:hypothetical protein